MLNSLDELTPNSQHNLTKIGLEFETMTTGDRIKQALKEKGVKAAQLATAIQATKGAVSQWVNDITTPSGVNLIKISQYLNVSADWLISGKEAKTPQIESNATFIEDQIAPWDSSTPLEDDEVEVPFFTEIELAAGTGSLLTHQNNGPKLRFSRATLKRQGVLPDAAVCVSITGNSMEPVLPDGCTVGVDTNTTDIRDGKMYAIRQGDLVRIKLLYRIPGGGLRVRSFNRDEYPDEEYRGEQMADMVIIGRIFWSSALW